jgi:hypothetical protein
LRIIKAVPPLTVAGPKDVTPSIKVIVPVAVLGETVAVQTTLLRKRTKGTLFTLIIGVTVSATVVAVPVGAFTLWPNAGDVIPMKFVSPLYTAVIE